MCKITDSYLTIDITANAYLKSNFFAVSDVRTNMMAMATIQSYDYRKLTLTYGPGRSHFVSYVFVWRYMLSLALNFWFVMKSSFINLLCQCKELSMHLESSNNQGNFRN